MNSSRSTAMFGAMCALCLLAVGAALVSQHVFDMQPCPWCVLQRMIFLAVAIACLIGLVWHSRSGRAISAVLAITLSLCGAAAALWQHFVAASATSCNLTLADRIIGATDLDSLLPDVFSPRASCADAAVKLIGIPYDVWSLVLFFLLALMAFVAMSNPTRYQ